jgi:hypothetical protein
MIKFGTPGRRRRTRLRMPLALGLSGLLTPCAGPAGAAAGPLALGLSGFSAVLQRHT